MSQRKSLRRPDKLKANISPTFINVCNYGSCTLVVKFHNITDKPQNNGDFVHFKSLEIDFDFFKLSNHLV